MRFLIGSTADSFEEILFAPIPLLDFDTFVSGLRKTLDGILLLLLSPP